jgi:acyl-CoA dehydrogenase
MPRDVLSAPIPAWRQREELQLYAQSVAAFAEKHIDPDEEQWRKDKVVPREVWTTAGAAGLLVPSCPEDYGGAGGDYAYDAVFMEEVYGRGDSGWGAPLHNSVVAPYVWIYGTEEQKKRWLPKLVSGERISAIAMTEPGAGSDLQGVKTTAVRDGNGYRINGSKTFITNGGTADFIVLVVKTDPKQGAKGISLMVIETDGPGGSLEGFRRGRKLDKVGQDAQDTSELFFDDVWVPSDALLGTEEGSGFYQLMEQLPQERLHIAVCGQAMIERALELTIAYVKERKAFGKAIIDFQNTQFELAECKTEATISRIFVDSCIERHIKGELDTATASMAKYWVSDLQCTIIDRCLQLFGGYGYMNEYPIARMWRDARVQRIYGGTNEIMKLLIARTL